MQEDLTAAACVKAHASDLKNWMRVNSKYLRLIPLAYAGADAPPMSKTKNAEDYTVMKIMGLLCGDKMVNGVSQSSIDIYGGATFLGRVPIVLALGEFGCNTQMPRQWTMVPYLFSNSAASKGFTDSFSGGCAYTFGEASVSDDRFPMFKGGSKEIEGLPGTSPTVDYTNLAAQYKAAPSASEKGNFTKDTICGLRQSQHQARIQSSWQQKHGGQPARIQISSSNQQPNG
ncbi:Obg-like ATPase [Aphanomyces cochlioides]|nr:Obg-like ATPase [Aphanomyces cochlioides]